MKRISTSDINDKYVLILREDENNHLSVEQLKIDGLDVLVTEIEAMIENPEKTLWDIYSKVYKRLDKKLEYNLCYPFEYTSSFVDLATCPEELSLSEYNLIIEKDIKSIKADSYYRSLADLKKEEYLKKKLALKDLPRKKKYVKQVVRYLKCQQLSKTLDEAKNKTTTKMYSSDSIGWTTFNYNISKDINVIVKTNFVYGASAYFYIAVKYKDIVLIPYSDLVHYYYANMKNFISYTRSYACKRDSWFFALNFVADFVNKSNQDPIEFIRQYICAELNEMMKGLREIIKHPEEVFDLVKGNFGDYISLRVIRPFNSYDDAIYKMLPSESIAVFKAEKISGALLFVNSLLKISSLCPEVISCINEIKDMNLSIKDEITGVLCSINNDLAPLLKEQTINDKRLDYFYKKIKFHDGVIELKQRKKSFCEHDKIRESYIKFHPQYSKLKKNYEELQSKQNELIDIIRKRSNLKDRMTICLERIVSNA